MEQLVKGKRIIRNDVFVSANQIRQDTTNQPIAAKLALRNTSRGTAKVAAKAKNHSKQQGSKKLRQLSRRHNQMI